LVGGGLVVVLLGLVVRGSGKAQVSGWVTCHGQPVSSGAVLLIGRDGIPCYGTIQPDGSYFVKRVTTGVVKVAVTSPAPLGPILAQSGVGSKFQLAETAAVTSPDNWFPLPVHYGDPATSELTFEVKRGLNAFDIDLK
jgi:hypothetical protein